MIKGTRWRSPWRCRKRAAPNRTCWIAWPPTAAALDRAALDAALADKAAFIGSAADQVDRVVAAVDDLVSAYRMPPSTPRCDPLKSMSLKDIDFTDLDNFADGFPAPPVRDPSPRSASCTGFEPTENTPDGEGFWSVATAKPLRCFVMRTPSRR